MIRVGGALLLWLMLLAMPAVAQNQPQNLILLGEKTVGLSVDREVIDMSHDESWFSSRTFRTLHIMAERNDVYLLALRLVYFNGFMEDIPVDRTIRTGSQMAVDLRGERSYLRRIELTYRARPSFRGDAVVRVFGEPIIAQPPSPNSDWLLLGEKSVGFAVDRDIVAISHSEEWFKDRSFSKLHLMAERNDVHLIAVRIVYLNGFAESIGINRLIGRGEPLAVDLRGQRSFLRKIELTYRAKPSFRGDALIRIYGEPQASRAGNKIQ
jgi:hypothetical protein